MQPKSQPASNTSPPRPNAPTSKLTCQYRSATDTGHNGAAAMPFNFQSHSDAFWSSFRSLSNAFLHTHHNTAALMQVNRKLADELLEIARRQQNYALEFSEKLLHQMSAASPVVKHVESMRPESFDEYFDSAIQGIREFGQAIAEAQAAGWTAHRMKVLPEVIYELQFWKLPAAEAGCPPQKK